MSEPELVAWLNRTALVNEPECLKATSSHVVHQGSTLIVAYRSIGDEISLHFLAKSSCRMANCIAVPELIGHAPSEFIAIIGSPDWSKRDWQDPQESP